jgi:hypothetical protein
MRFIHLILAISCALSFPALQAQTCEEYAKEMEKIFNGIRIGLPVDSVKLALPGIKKVGGGMDFRDEYLYNVKKNGLQEVTFYFDKDGEKPLYEIIFEFKDADSTHQLVRMMFGEPSHPTLDDHWVLGLGENGISSLVWTFENRMVLAVNLPDTELTGESSFELPQDFIDKMNGIDSDTPVPNASSDPEPTPDDAMITLQLNSYIANALTDFEHFKGEAIAGKKDEFEAAIAFSTAENTIIRRKTGTSWRLESRITTQSSVDEARSYFESLKKTIESLEALEYRLVKKSEYSTNTGNTFIWDVQTLDGDPLAVIVKLQLYAAGTGRYSVKMEIGK